MEPFLNLCWLLVCVTLFLCVRRAARLNRLRVPRRTALTAVFAICMILLPVISMTDDLLADHQANLPLAAQTWHVASEGASVGLELVSLVCACWLAFLAATIALRATVATDWDARPQAAWLLRAQRLRPPPALSH